MDFYKELTCDWFVWDSNQINTTEKQAWSKATLDFYRYLTCDGFVWDSHPLNTTEKQP